jgi:predicted Fe-S protein YdhL (DUF1289 family)
MAGIHITDLESAINYWRGQQPSVDGVTLSAPTRALAEVYALMVFQHETEADETSMPAKALAAWLQWYASTPDTPCIAICSTSQGDEECKGCGRSFFEVQHWPQMTPGEKRHTWRRITLQSSAWRFNKYAERAAEGPQVLR